jgi:hypothetical protein
MLRTSVIGPALLALAFFTPVGKSPSRAASPAVPPAAVAPDRIDTLSRKYLGTPYRLDCLGEGTGADPDPLFTRRYVDCQTLVEQVMAEVIAPWAGGLDRAGRLVRYHGGAVSLENRYHYCIPDWLANPWPARDVTETLRGARHVRTHRRIDRPAFLASRGGDPSRSPTPCEQIGTSYIPRADVSRVMRLIPDGSIGLLVIDNPGVVAGHAGFLFRRNGKVLFRHASQTRRRVIEEPLPTYLARAPRRQIGLKVLQPDVAGLQR